MTETKTKWAIIGDIHSQIKNLKKALDYCSINNLRPLLLGDIFDSRCPTSDSYAVYKTLLSAEKSMGAIVLQSNHQDKLIRFLKGNNISESYGLTRTIADLHLRSDSPLVDKEELLNWLDGMPYGAVIHDSSGNQYRASHAYFSDKVSEMIDEKNMLHDKEYLFFYESTFYDVDTLSVNFNGNNPPKKSFKRIRDEMIYGPIGRIKELSYFDSPRLAWWNNPTERTWTMVAGHYHLVHYDPKKKAIILDSGCGDEGGRLTLFDVDRKLIFSF